MRHQVPVAEQVVRVEHAQRRTAFDTLQRARHPNVVDQHGVVAPAAVQARNAIGEEGRAPVV